jgi:hypothetical protein
MALLALGSATDWALLVNGVLAGAPRGLYVSHYHFRYYFVGLYAGLAFIVQSKVH